MTDIVDEASTAAIEVLRRCVTPAGFRASAGEDGYRQVWARDSMITLLGACAAGLEEMLPAMRASLVTLTAAQRPSGYIPLNVELEDSPAGQGDPGGIDSNLWYLIGHHVLHRTFEVDDLLERHREPISRAMRWMRYQDSDDDGLIESQPAADWSDLLANHGKVLYANVLYVLALRAYADLAERLHLEGPAEHRSLAAEAVRRLNELHWVSAPLGLWDPDRSPGLASRHAETRRIVQLTTAELWSRPFYLPWVGFREYGDWCDVFGNSLAVVIDVADARRRAEVLDYFTQVGASEPLPAKAIHPPIQPGERHWRSYYRNGNLCLPHQYHNGGCWPLIGGFLVAALVRDGRMEAAGAELRRLAAAMGSTRDGWEFNEWYHGVTGRAMGKREQAWSAAMVLFARRAVSDGQVPYLPL